MTEAVIAAGEKVHIVTRRNFKEASRRHFAGTVTAVFGTLIRVEGYMFVFNPNTLEIKRKMYFYTSIFGLGDTSQIVLVLPPDTVVERLHYSTLGGTLVFGDDLNFEIDVSEYAAKY